MRTFSADVSAWVQKAKGNMDAAVRNVAIEAAERIVDRTPILNGEARGGWKAGINSFVPTPTGRLDKTGAETLGTIRADLANAKAGDVIFITNHEPHIVALEHGLSDQAPAGMVTVTAKEFANIVAVGAYKANKP